MEIANSTILVTGANRGIGQSPDRGSLEERRQAGLCRYPPTLAHPDGRVTPLTLDVTDAAQIQAAVESVESLDILSTMPAWRSTTTSAIVRRSSSTSPSTSSAPTA